MGLCNRMLALDISTILTVITSNRDWGRNNFITNDIETYGVHFLRQFVSSHQLFRLFSSKPITFVFTFTKLPLVRKNRVYATMAPTYHAWLSPNAGTKESAGTHKASYHHWASSVLGDSFNKQVAFFIVSCLLGAILCGLFGMTPKIWACND